MSLPVCSTCGSIKTKAPKGALYCKICTKAYRDKNKNKIKEYLKEYRNGHRQDNVEYQQKYRELNREALLEKKKHHRLQNIELYTLRSMKFRCYNPKSKYYKDYGGRGIRVCDRWLNDPKTFLEDMGPRPGPNYSIDRIDVNGHYEPNNCKWSTGSEQANNTRQKREYRISIPEEAPIYYPYGNLITLREFAEKTNLPLIIAKYRYAEYPMNDEWILSDTADGRLYKYRERNYSMTELALMSKVSFGTMNTRIRQYGWSTERAVNTPPLIVR